MYTANTMATAIESMGMTLPGSSSNPAESDAKHQECLRAGLAIRNLLEKDIRPRDIMTRSAFENAMVVVNITGGSTNAVLHLIAIAHSVDVKLTIDDFQKVSDRTPFLADLKPSGKYVMADLYGVGGTPALLKYLLENELIDGNIMTVTGETLAENLKWHPGFPDYQKIIRPLSNPIKNTGHIQILRGSLAPGGCVGKITGKEGLRFEGKAKVYNSEDLMVEALERGDIKKGEKTVVVIRYEGPKGAPGMVGMLLLAQLIHSPQFSNSNHYNSLPEMLKPSSAIMGAGLGQDVALITDGRFSGGSHGFLIGKLSPDTPSSSSLNYYILIPYFPPGHIVPEAQEGGPIALVENGDTIIIDTESRKLDLMVSEDILVERRKKYKQPPLKYNKGTLYKYAKYVTPFVTFINLENNSHGKWSWLIGGLSVQGRV